MSLPNHLTPEYIEKYMKKLAWFDKNPMKPIKVSESCQHKNTAKNAFNRVVSAKN